MNKATTKNFHAYSRFFLFGMVLIIGAIASGCTTLTPAITTSDTSRHPYQEKLSLNGRIHILYQQGGKEQSLPGNFEWLQNETDTNITLLSQLGQTIASINQNATGATLQQANQPTRTSPDLDTLLGETLGWPMPMLGLRDWLQGYIKNQEGKRIAVQAKENQTSIADGWQLRYVSWQEDAGKTHPRRIDLRRYTAQAGEVTLRIIIDEWKAP